MFEQFMPQKQTQGENQNRKKFKEIKFETFFAIIHYHLREKKILNGYSILRS
jgi:hypothetical protein